MLSQLMRSSRGLLVVGAVLALVAFALVVFLLSQKSSSSTSSAQPTATLGLTSGALATSTPITATANVSAAVVVPPAGQQEVEARADIKAGTILRSQADVAALFKDHPILPREAVHDDPVDSVGYMQTVLVSNTIKIVTPLRKSDILTRLQIEVQPYSPPGSLSYNVRPGRVAETITVPPLAADNAQILAGDFVNMYLTIHPYKDLSQYTSNPPTGGGGPEQTQQLIPDIRVIAVAPGGIFTLELTPQNAALVKYVKDTGGQIDLMLMSSDDARVQTAPVKTNPIVPEYFQTPEVLVQGTPQGKGLLYPFATPLPTYTPIPTSTPAAR